MSLCLHGCATRPHVVMDEKGLRAARILASTDASFHNIKSFRGAGRFKMLRNKTSSFRLAWIGSEPDRLRLEVLGPWGQPTLSLLVNGATYSVFSRQDNRLVTGDATAQNLSRIISLPMDAGDLFRILAGHPPVPPFDRARGPTETVDGRCVVSLYKGWRRLVQKIWFREDQNTVEQVEVFDGWGHLQYRIVFNDFREVGGVRLSHAMVLSDGRGPLCSLVVDKFTLGVPVPEGAFMPVGPG